MTQIYLAHFNLYRNQSYDDRGRIISSYLNTTSGGASALSYRYQYDNYGNRTAKTYYYGSNIIQSYEWERGRLLKNIKNTSGGVVGAYTYDVNGVRYTKTSDGVTTTYFYDGNTLLGENRSDGTRLRYFYDATGLCGFSYFNGSETQYYTYVKDVLGNIVMIKDHLGLLMTKYTYDEWGNCTANNLVGTIGNVNPFRYRGYYYDSESGLYYLMSRYYDPEIGQFISMDTPDYLKPETIGGVDLYVYGLNNPIMYVDPTGHIAISTFLIGLAVTSLIGWGLSEIFGAQIAGGIGSISGGATAISTGISLCAFGPWGMVAGIVLMAIGGFTIVFGANEIIDGATGTNYIQQWTGWSDSIYNGVYIGLNVASAVGSIAGNIGMRIASNNILNSIVKNPSKITNYKLWQVKTFGRYASNYIPGVMQKGAHAGQGYTLTNSKQASLGYIQWHPGGGHHGPLAYWKITSCFNRAARFYYLSGLPF